ncbi:hypothetical protein A1O1_06859 [Capronia coronata CBS 617.96]|uniref:Amine oxidase domain-containing protein n=1 Tax=Capronia coronata CBS 617.96 TaxID=1182541 RepID=W9Y0S2_9EURO|nr:uncharacterized protein A1O1_06859 [Capronia coronata CBS 617.96]EXJ83240.1 hypothetical protein A1O1_06859 [Capronia coronata CBS 617.96]
MYALRQVGQSTKGRIPHVAVVGAGISGLRCSDVLARAGVKVTLFEARDRIGGRVHQVESGGYLVDMGPNWIHGTKGNPITEIAERTGTKVMEPEEEEALVDSNGTRRSNAEAVELSGKVWEMLVGAFKYSDEHSATIDPHTSLAEYFREQLSSMDIDEKRRQDILHEAQMWGPFVGDAVEKQSLKFFFLEECIEGENVFVASTYKDILKEAGRTATDPAKVELRLETEIVHYDTTGRIAKENTDGTETGTRVDGGSKVEAGQETTTVTSTQDEDEDEDGHARKVTVTASTGERLSFDQVVVTCPLGWLKRYHTSAFTPALPPRLCAAIENINYGRLEKLYVTFPTAFWLSPNGDDHQHQRDEKSELDKAISTLDANIKVKPAGDSSPSYNSNPAPDAQSASNYPFFTHFHDPAYIPHPIDEAWNQSVASLARLPAPHAHPTLLFYMYGACATHVVRSVQDLTPYSAEYNAVLTAFAQPFYSRLPNYSASDPSCTPTSLLMTQWQADRFAGNGSYCNFQVGLERGDEDIEVMRAGVVVHSSDGIKPPTHTGLWLAGEHTAPFIALGTTTGAWWSGEGVARRICAAYGLDVPGYAAMDTVTAGQLDGQAVEREPEPRKKDLDAYKPDAANMAGLAI